MRILLSLLSIIGLAALAAPQIKMQFNKHFAKESTKPVQNQAPTKMISATEHSEITQETLQQIVVEVLAPQKIKTTVQVNTLKDVASIITKAKITVKEPIASIETKKQTSDSVTTKQAVSNQIIKDISKTNSTIAISNFSASLATTVLTDNKEFADGSKTLGSHNSLSLGYKINDTYSSSLSTSLAKDLKNNYEETIGNTNLTISHKSLKLTDKLSLSPSVTTVIPTSKVSQKRDKLITTIVLSPSFSYKLNPTFTASYRPGVTTNFHQYKTNRVGTNLVKYKFSQSLGLGMSINDEMSLSTSFSYLNAWSYGGTERDPAFSTSLSGTYLFKNDISFTLGLSTGGALYATEKGPDKNIEIYNKDTTSYLASLAITF